MIRLLISVAFALAVATSADAMSPARLHEPDAMFTQIRNVRPPHQPCDLPSQVRINGICMLRTTPPVRRPQIHNVRSAHQPCDLPSQVRINGICMLRTTPPGPPTANLQRPLSPPTVRPCQSGTNQWYLHVAHHPPPGPPTRLPQVCGMERRYVR